MQSDPIIAAARSVASLAPAVSALDGLAVELKDIERACARGYFTPEEDERVRARFAQYLAARAALLQTIEELKPIACSRDGAVDPGVQQRAFIVAYAAAALLVRAARTIVERIARDAKVQRKLNEAEPRLGIPRKQFTAIYRSVTNPLAALHLARAMNYMNQRRVELEAMANDPHLEGVMDHLRDAEEFLPLPKRAWLRARLSYRWHSLRRRRESAMNHAMFGIFELAGRAISELRNPLHRKRVTPEIQRQLAAVLRPGDVLVSRHDDAMSNLFLPGYWVHASLHIGSEAERRALGVQVDSERESRWIEPIRVLEARKDGVRFRPLNDTLSVDAVAVIRPKLAESDLAQAVARAVTHEGKLYDFEFDFFRSDRLVCTGVVYRGFQGVGGLEFNLTSRAGRPTLSAEDLLAMALDGRGYEPIAVFGAPMCTARIVYGDLAWQALASSCMQSPARS